MSTVTPDPDSFLAMENVRGTAYSYPTQPRSRLAPRAPPPHEMRAVTLPARPQPGIRPYDRHTRGVCLIQAVEAYGRVFPSFKHHQTGANDRQAFSVDGLENRFDILSAEETAPRADAEIVCLVGKAHRLAHAYPFTPLFATGTGLTDLLPHSSPPCTVFPRRARCQRGSRERPPSRNCAPAGRRRRGRQDDHDRPGHP